MQIKILGSTKPEYKLSKEEAINFAGKSAGICYLPDTIEELFNEPEEKTIKRANMTLLSGHHSVYDHPSYNLALIEVPKIIAMILNNEGMYTTSEKSARYTKMKVSDKEEELYNKWIEIFKEQINKEYPNIKENRVKKLAQENARCLISIFSPSTTMEYTTSLRQINYIANFFENYIKYEENNDFNNLLKPYLKEFVDRISNLRIPELNADVKERKIALFDERENRKEEFGENYCTTYFASFSQFAQAQRHRTINYKIRLLDTPKYYIPDIIKGTCLEEEWIKDMKELEYRFPQGMLVKVNERGTAENFILKCQERLCGAAQLEIMLQTKRTLDKYIENTKESNKEVYEYLQKYSCGARCKFPNFKCTAPCIWGPNGAMTRKI